MTNVTRQFLAIPFVHLARREQAASDPIERRGGPTEA